jgi:hypothetical protein
LPQRGHLRRHDRGAELGNDQAALQVKQLVGIRHSRGRRRAASAAPAA